MELHDRRVLVPVDGSENSMKTVSYLADTLPPKGVEVVLFHIMTKVPESFWDLEKEPAYHYRIADVREWETQQAKAIEKFMKKASEKFLSQGFPQEAIRIKQEERRLGIARDIIEETQRGYDAVAVGRRGLSEIKDLVMGSIANKLVEKLSHVPIWIVDSERQGGKILIALDTSDAAMMAVDHVAKMIGGMQRFQVTLFHAFRGVNIFRQLIEKSGGGDRLGIGLETVNDEFDEISRDIEPVFEEAERRLVRAGMSSAQIGRKIKKGVSTRGGAIVDEAERGDYGTIVVGRRGLSRVQEFFMGRVSNKVVHLARDKTVWVVS